MTQVTYALRAGTAQKPGNVDEAREAGTDAQADVEKGSPMHLWKALVAEGKTEGATITTAEVRNLRDWSDSTVGLELRSLVDIGVLERVMPGVFKVLVTATNTQINTIHEEAKSIVNKNLNGGALGLDAHRLDAEYLGAEKTSQLNALVARNLKGQAPIQQLASVGAAAAADFEGYLAATKAAIREIFETAGATFTLADANGDDETSATASALKELLDLGLLNLRAVVEDTVSNKYNFQLTEISIVAFDGAAVLADTASFISNAREAQADQKQVVIVALDDAQERTLQENVQLNALEGIYISRLSGTAATQWKTVLAGAGFLDITNMQATKVLANKELIRGLVTAK